MRLGTPAELGNVARARRRQLDLSQVETARRAGMSRQSLMALEAGSSNPTWDTLLRLATVLGLEFSVAVAESPLPRETALRRRPRPRRSATSLNPPAPAAPIPASASNRISGQNVVRPDAIDLAAVVDNHRKHT